MLPTGATPGVSDPILWSLPDQDDGADDQRGASNGRPDNGRVPIGTAARTGHADPPPRAASEIPRTLRQL